jgi:hypothetical protein
MKKSLTLLFVAVIMAGAAFAQELTFSGEVKTGVYWENVKEGDGDSKDTAQLGNNDDAGYPGPGRIRLNAELKKETIGFKVRWETSAFQNNIAPNCSYAYAYGSFINDQLKFSAGKLGDSPWATSGYEINSTLDDGRAGLRTELKPGFLPGLNLGFVLNEADATLGQVDKTIETLLGETIIGISYIHEFFEVRFAYRFDSKNDMNLLKNEGSKIVYRVEEKILDNIVPGLSLWANGRYDGLVAEEEGVTRMVNWVYVQYAPGALNVQLRTGLDLGYKLSQFIIKPVLTYDITNFLTLGFIFQYAKDTGEIAIPSPYTTLAVEPLIRVNFGPMYVAFVYGYNSAYTAEDRIKTTHYANLRFVYTF